LGKRLVSQREGPPSDIETICFPSRYFSREAAMNQNRDVQNLRDKASRYRAIARQTIDPEAARRIFELTEELEQQARDMERGK
jgi:hypothetical protein